MVPLSRQVQNAARCLRFEVSTADDRFCWRESWLGAARAWPSSGAKQASPIGRPDCADQAGGENRVGDARAGQPIHFLVVGEVRIGYDAVEGGSLGRRRVDGRPKAMLARVGDAEIRLQRG